MAENKLLQKAKKRVKAKKEFFAHLMSYCLVIPFLFLVNFMTSPDFWWFLFPLGGWGMAVAGHYFSVFGFLGIQSWDWEKKELAKEMGRLKEQEEDADFLAGNHRLPEDRLELKERIKLPEEWDDQDLV